jgi:hypothetical protein
VECQLGDLRPEDIDPLRRGPRKITPDDLKRATDLDIVSLIRQLIVRVERLETDMRQVKEKLKL